MSKGNPTVSHLEKILRGDGVLPCDPITKAIERRNGLTLSDMFGRGDATETIYTPPQTVCVTPKETPSEEVNLVTNMASSASASAAAAAAAAAVSEDKGRKRTAHQADTPPKGTSEKETTSSKKARVTAEPVAIGNVLGKKGAVHGKNLAAIPPSPNDTARIGPKSLSPSAASAAAAAAAAMPQQPEKVKAKAKATPKAKAKSTAKPKAKARPKAKAKARAKAKTGARGKGQNKQPHEPEIQGSHVHPDSIKSFKALQAYKSMCSWSGISFAEKRAGPSTADVPIAARSAQIDASGRIKEGQQLLRVILRTVMSVDLAGMFERNRMEAIRAEGEGEGEGEGTVLV